MDEKNFCWQLFLETGEPEAYLFYRAAERRDG